MNLATGSSFKPIVQFVLEDLFESVACNGTTSAQCIRERIESSGLQADDRRLSLTMARLSERSDQPIDLEAFRSLVADEALMLKCAFTRQLVIPEWGEFCSDIHALYNAVSSDRSGANADYIPILRDADPEPWGVAVCSVDGQRLAIGDVDLYHSIQSVSKPLTYAHALATEGVEFTHQFVGVEPSGRPFNAMDLLPDHRPFNPGVNAGAIMIAGLVASADPDFNSRQITQRLMDLWSRLSGGVAEVRFSEETMLSERETADHNFAISYLLPGPMGQRDLSDLRWGVLCGDRSALLVRDRMLSCMLAITLADGEIEDPEIDAMSLIYTELMGHPPDRDALHASAQAMASQVDSVQLGRPDPLQALLQQLRQDRARLDDKARELILESAFRVACSDEEIEPEEDRLLRSLAEALGIGSGVLELEIERFRRRGLAANGKTSGV